MSANDEWQEWHLTTTGWVEGTESIDQRIRRIIEKPNNCVATFKYSEYISSSFSPIAYNWLKTWGEDMKEIEGLIVKYGKFPNDFIRSNIEKKY
jgi:hypothetical protein